MSKPNKEGWIRHRGGKCPVDKGVLIDVRRRHGQIVCGIPALSDGYGTCHDDELSFWRHEGDGSEIMAYRLHKPEQQDKSELRSKAIEEAVDLTRFKPAKQPRQQTDEMPAAKHFDGPLQWRDRIREIGNTVEALEEERVSLVQKLEAEGFRLIEPVKAEPVKAEPAEDMSDWRNWRVGDLLLRIDESYPSVYTPGNKYPILKFDNGLPCVQDNFGEESYCRIERRELSVFKWHSRPSA